MWHRQCRRLIGDLASAGEGCDDCGESGLCNINGGGYEYFDGSEDIPEGCAVAAGHRSGGVTLRLPATIHRPSPGIHHVAQTSPFPPGTLFSLFIPTAHTCMHGYSTTSIRRTAILYPSWPGVCIARRSWWIDPRLHARVRVSAQSIAAKQDTAYKINSRVYIKST